MAAVAGGIPVGEADRHGDTNDAAMRITPVDIAVGGRRPESLLDTRRLGGVDFLPPEGGGFPSAVWPIRLRPGASRRGVPVSAPTAERRTLAV
ncbi:hypothetical protein GCM10029978_068950 [Actinoallomurus acanthiterrae]